MTLYAGKNAVWLLLLLWTSHEYVVGATPLRGTVFYKPLPLFKRQLAMEMDTLSPTNSPSISPSPYVYPTIEATESPTIVPTEAGTSTPTTNTNPTSWPATDTPTSQPTTVASAQPTVPATAAPTLFELPPTVAPSTQTPPTQTPPTQTPPTPSLLPTDAALFRVPLADFQLQYNGEDGEGIQAVMEQYLADSMKLDFLRGVELSDMSRRQRRRRLQQSSSTKSFSGDAFFDDLSVPSLENVQASQTVALEDTDALQQAFNDANLDVTVENVVIEKTETSSSSFTDNAGLIAGIFVAAMVVLSLAAFFCYRRWFSSKVDKNGHQGEHAHDHEKDLVKYTPDDFDPAITTSQSVDVEEELPENLDESSLDVDEYSLSAMSADSSVKKDSKRGQQSLLQRLALYQKAELKSSPVRNKQNEVPMPAAFLMPGAIQSSSTEGEDVPRAPTPTMVDHAPTPTKQSVSRVAATSLLQNDDDDKSDEGTEVDLLPPPPPPPLSDSSGSPPRISQDQPQKSTVVIPQAMKSNDFNAVLARLSRQRTPPRAGVVAAKPAVVTQAKHDFPSTTWQHPPVTVRPVVKAYSDGPSDELNFELEQDLTNFDVPAVVSPEPPTPPRIIRGRASPSPPPPPPPPRSNKN